LDRFDDLPLIAVFSIFSFTEKAFRVLESDYTAAGSNAAIKRKGGGTDGRARLHNFTGWITRCSGDGRTGSGARR
jgi:hypothetical protein